jgi:hypothetical protein
LGCRIAQQASPIELLVRIVSGQPSKHALVLLGFTSTVDWSHNARVFLAQGSLRFMCTCPGLVEAEAELTPALLAFLASIEDMLTLSFVYFNFINVESHQQRCISFEPVCCLEGCLSLGRICNRPLCRCVCSAITDVFASCSAEPCQAKRL